MTDKNGSTEASEPEKERTESIPDGSGSDGSDSNDGEDTASGGGADE